MTRHQWKTWTTKTVLIALVLAPAAMAAPGADLAQVVFDDTSAKWHILQRHDGSVLTVQTPWGIVERVYEADSDPVFRLDEVAPDAPDGAYTWQVRIQPVVSAEARKELARARATGDEEIVRRLTRKGLLPQGTFVQSGSFQVIDGVLVAPGEVEETGADGAAGASSIGGLEAVTAVDVVHGDDLIVSGSLCVGFDCANGEEFEFDTIRLKENNLRIKLEDTSSSTGFPTTDWQLTANDSASGGLNKFSIEDVTAATVPFTVEGGAPTHSVYVGSTGRIGFRTATPTLDLHVSTSDTPGIRLEQTSGGGLAAQTWDVAGNDTNFFVRDVTGGSRLPLRIRPGAPTSSIDVSAVGNVGLGTTAPAEKLHVVGNARVDGSLIAPITIGTGGVVQPTLGRNAEGGLTVSANGVTASTADLLRVATHGGTTVFQVEANGGVFVNSAQVHPDYVFTPEYELESIEEHTRRMWENQHLPAVGPGLHDEDGRAIIDLGGKTLGMLEELEKAHIYIGQLDERLTEEETANAELTARVQALETLVLQLVGQQ